MQTYTEQDAQAGRGPAGRRGSGTYRSGGRKSKGGKRKDDGHDGSSVRPKDPGKYKAMVIVGAILMVISGIVVVGDRVFRSIANSSVKQEDLLPPEMREAGKNITGAVNVLMLGMDERTNSTALIHSDSIIIAHITAAHDKVYLVSLPRDTMVQVPAYPPSGYKGGTLKLTESFALGNMNSKGQGDDSPDGRKRGVGLLVKAINTFIPGITFNAVAIINFVGFQKLVEALGGVTMCIDQRVESVHYARSGKYMGEDIYQGPGYLYLPGCRHLLPWEALDYVRQRENLPHGDYDRQRHQQQFMAAVFKELASAGTLTDITKFSALKDAVGQLLTLDLNGTDVADWIFSFKNLRPSEMTMVQTNGGNYVSQNVDGKSYQMLSADSLRLMQALKSDQIASFLSLHPDWIATTGNPGTTTSPSPN
jgi:polyisoprenyl-teichoic acid--peptidoglycan teichoic acid transferase